MSLYDPPAAINDFGRRPARESELRAGWNAQVRDFIAATKDPASSTPSGLYFDQLGDTSGLPDPAPVGVPWNAFPQNLTNWFATQQVANQEKLANTAAESAITTDSLFGLFRKTGNHYDPIPMTYRRQDEYCEWFVTKRGNAISRMSFTCEPPEYWSYLASKDITLVLELYRELLHEPAIQQAELCWPYERVLAPQSTGAAGGGFQSGRLQSAQRLEHGQRRGPSDALGELAWRRSAAGIRCVTRLAPAGRRRHPHRLVCCAGLAA